MGPRVGILLGREAARAAMVRPGRRGAPPTVLARAEAAVDPSAWSGSPERLGEAFRALARGLPGGARRIDRPLSVALPDPVVTEDRLTFREVPADRGELAELVRFRVARDRRTGADALACAAEPLGRGGEVLVRVLPRALLRAVEEGAHGAGFVPRRVEGWAALALEHAARRAGGDAGAWLWSDGASWALMCWCRGDAGEDSAQRADTHLHAEWRRPGDGAALAGKAARIAKSFAMRCGVGRLTLVLDLAEADDVARGLEGDPILAVGPRLRLPEPVLCVALP